MDTERLRPCRRNRNTIGNQNGIIKSMNLVGDYFLVGEIDEFLNKFQNVPFTPQSVNRILDDNPIENYIRQLSRKNFIDILFNNN